MSLTAKLIRTVLTVSLPITDIAFINAFRITLEVSLHTGYDRTVLLIRFVNTQWITVILSVTRQLLRNAEAIAGTVKFLCLTIFTFRRWLTELCN